VHSNSPSAGRLLGGGALALAVALLISGLLWSIWQAALTQPPGQSAILPDITHLLRMTSIQAGLTTILSVLIGIALAWALNRLDFPGRNIVAALFASALVTPGLVVAFGLLAVWGRNGWINALIEPFGLHAPGIFGLWGIIAAHLLLDATLAARLLLARLDAVSPSRLRTGQSLGFGPWQRFRLIDWPAVSGSLPGVAALIFLLAFTSFPIVLLLGGGPANQTFEVAIYSAVRLDFDLAGAVRLALVQLAVCALIILPAASLSTSAALAGSGRPFPWPDGSAIRALQILVLVLAVVGFALPLAAVLTNGLGPALWGLFQSAAFWRAAATSLLVGTLSACLMLAAAIILSAARSEARSPILRAGLGFPAFAYLAVPAVVLSLGFFLSVRTLGVRPSLAAPGVLILANALLSLPFAVATLSPGFGAIATRYGRLSRSLGMGDMQRLRVVELPMLAREIGIVLAIGFCFSLGDLGVIALFGTDDFATLPWLMVRALGAYRSSDAAGIAAFLLVLSISAFSLIPAIFARWSHADD
jgi:thiamine transport system permease protein